MIAQIPTSSAGEIGALLVAAAAILAIVFLVLSTAKLVKDMFWPANPVAVVQAPAPTYARQEDLTKLEAYVHTSVHELRNGLNALHLKLVETRETITRDVAASTNKIVGELSRLSAIVERERFPAGTSALRLKGDEP